MEMPSFLELLEQQYKSQLPFVAYRKPNQKQVKALLQQDDSLHLAVDFTESGFVFAPFDNADQTVLIPNETSKNIESDFEDVVFKHAEDKVFEVDETEKDRHIRLVEKGIEAIRTNKFEKVVLSRKESVAIKSDSVFKLFADLLASYPTAFVYCWYHPKVGLWLGATPETLLSVENKRLSTMALAGTQQYTGSLEVAWGVKEKEEQAFVTTFISDSLEPYVTHLKQGNVKTVKAGKLLHLQTSITALLKSSLKPVIDALHPTPAVCGLPKLAAKNFIINNENYQRTFYTGFLGELNLKVDKSRNRNPRNIENNVYRALTNATNLYVNLRCMEVVGSMANVFVGGGITKDSHAESEWNETVAKAMTMKKVLQ
ncbi:isochorismate synthase [Mangrovimonas yunxiaonensis]|uniref:Isochorismate synthase n=2 Tax=Mangrovimonas yunxiaonensis TaxID=1197477 RepID=A0A084THI8_9FLAO|nr:isochorismate synthase [Mangrovimonas yunxiaonensis]GGH42338.1 hypothetical protein GCM10011364_13770 [Mangrovimonas yunxiaonensis]